MAEVDGLEIVIQRRERELLLGEQYSRSTDDTHKVSLVLPSGCMRGAEETGYILALSQKGLLKHFDVIVGSSVGAIVLMFLKNPALGIQLFRQLTADRKFIDIEGGGIKSLMFMARRGVADRLPSIPYPDWVVGLGNKTGKTAAMAYALATRGYDKMHRVKTFMSQTNKMRILFRILRKHFVGRAIDNIPTAHRYIAKRPPINTNRVIDLMRGLLPELNHETTFKDVLLKGPQLLVVATNGLTGEPITFDLQHCKTPKELFTILLGSMNLIGLTSETPHFEQSLGQRIPLIDGCFSEPVPVVASANLGCTHAVVPFNQHPDAVKSGDKGIEDLLIFFAKQFNPDIENRLRAVTPTMLSMINDAIETGVHRINDDKHISVLLSHPAPTDPVISATERSFPKIIQALQQGATRGEADVIAAELRMFNRRGSALMHAIDEAASVDFKPVPQSAAQPTIPNAYLHGLHIPATAQGPALA